MVGIGSSGPQGGPPSNIITELSNQQFRENPFEDDTEDPIELPILPHQLSNEISIQSPTHDHIVGKVSSPLALDTPNHAIDLLSFRLRLSNNEITSASGALAGFLSGLVVCPLDVAKTRFQAQGAFVKNESINAKANHIPDLKYKSAFQSISLIWKEEGIRGLYRGVVPITLGYFPTWMIYFSCYEHFKKFYKDHLTDDENLTYFASAISSGAISSTLTNPIWVVKTRLMLQMDNGKTIYDSFSKSGSSGSSVNPKFWYNGTFDAFRKMYLNEGIKVFYKGLLPSYFGLFHVAIQFPLYENFKKVFKIDDNANTGHTTKSKTINFMKFIFASSLSKMIASGVTYPHEVVRTRLQLYSSKTLVNESQTRALVRTVKEVIKNEGFRGFYSGFIINLARTVPASAVTLVSFEYFREYLKRFSY